LPSVAAAKDAIYNTTDEGNDVARATIAGTVVAIAAVVDRSAAAVVATAVSSDMAVTGISTRMAARWVSTRMSTHCVSTATMTTAAMSSWIVGS
jgi:hypothetical protein